MKLKPESWVRLEGTGLLSKERCLKLAPLGVNTVFELVAQIDGAEDGALATLLSMTSAELGDVRQRAWSVLPQDERQRLLARRPEPNALGALPPPRISIPSFRILPFQLAGRGVISEERCEKLAGIGVTTIAGLVSEIDRAPTQTRMLLGVTLQELVYLRRRAWRTLPPWEQEGFPHHGVIRHLGPSESGPDLG